MQHKLKITGMQESLLRQAIQQWRFGFIPINCVLCDEYRNLMKRSVSCIDCPVCLYTGKAFCYGTPDEKAYKTDRERIEATIAFGNIILKACGKEPM